MFTGLVQAIGTVRAARKSGDELDLEVELGLGERPLQEGESIALSGCCCTVTTHGPGWANFRLSEETLRRTWLGRAAAGTPLNIEPALRMGDPFGGHMVQGHVDGIGSIARAIDPEAGGELGVRVPPELHKYCVEKGSLTIDGVSLTIYGMADGVVTIAVIPHTAVETTLGRARVGDPVNLEVDVLGKYVEQLLAARLDGPDSSENP